MKISGKELVRDVYLELENKLSILKEKKNSSKINDSKIK